MKDEQWYHTQLQKYFDKQYKNYEEEIEWLPDPAINKWKFYIPTLHSTVILTCHGLGEITFVMQPNRKIIRAN